MNLDSHRSNGARNCVAYSSPGRMIFDREDPPMRLISGRAQSRFVDRLHRENVDDANRNALLVELLVCGERFKQGHTAGDYGQLVIGALLYDFGLPDLEHLIVR